MPPCPFGVQRGAAGCFAFVVRSAPAERFALVVRHFSAALFWHSASAVRIEPRWRGASGGWPTASVFPRLKMRNVRFWLGNLNLEL
ncbi:MAG: hypothetical protein LAO21_02415 [Acidobacteriia bacterium]|nr:hypothetical protein [Terriglobia bacterium]